MNETQWHATFVTASERNDQPGAPAPYLRRPFECAPGLVRSTLHVSALGLIEARLNGCVVGDEVLAPGWTSYRHRLAVSSYDVTDRVTVGENVLGAIVGEGWAVGRLGWGKDRQLWADRPTAFLQLDLEYPDRTEHVITDTSWRAGFGGILADSIYDGETFDARAEPDGWDRAGFDDATWGGVDPVEWDRATLFPRTAPPIRRTGEVSAVEIFTTPAGRTVVDFGQVLTGWVRFTVDGQAGTTVTLRHCETLIAGEPEYETNRTALATDRYTLRGDGPETWEPRFTFHGFRYVEVDGWPGALTADALTAIVVHSDMRRTGWFECSDPLINRLHENIVWSMRGNFVGIPTDCPQRDERLGWTGDINAFAPTASFLYDVSDVLESWLIDLAAEQDDDGSVPMVVPNIGMGAPVTALWGDVAVMLPSCLYEVYGGIDVLARQYESMRRYVGLVETRLDEEGVWSSGFQFGDWCDPDAPPENPAGAKADRHLVATAFFARTVAEIAQTAEALGQTGDAARYRALHEHVRAGFRHRWVAPSGLVADLSQTAYALAICFDLLEPDQEHQAGERLARLVRKAGNRIATGFAGTPFVSHALTRTGHIDLAYAMLMETGCPSFLYPVTMGATTVWERWDAIKPDGSLNRTGMTSLNHYALGAVATWLHRVVGGLTMTSPGYATMRIAPQPGGGLTHASIAHDTPHGRVTVAWRIEGRTLALDVTVPNGTTAEVIRPAHPADPVVVGPGHHHWADVWVASRPTLTDADRARSLTEPKLWAAAREIINRHTGFDIGAAEDARPQTVGDSLDRTVTISIDLHDELEATFTTLLHP